jgi:hypothetical protein
MPRPETPIDASIEALARFAAALRMLRTAAGKIPYHRLARAAHYSAAALSRAANGRRLPPWPVVRAYVLACRGDETEWRARWEATRAAVLAAHQPASPSGGK